MLHKLVGDKKVASLIWQHGMPSIADTPRGLRQRVGHNEDYKGLLQSSLRDCLKWWVCLANHMVKHRTQEGFDAQVSASSLDKQERERQQTRREALRKAQDALRLGADLAKQRDHGKRSYDDMDDTERQMLEDFETGKTKKSKQEFTTQRMKPFRCKLPIND